jgi:hypothetical protein
MRLLALFLFVGISIGHTCAQSTPPVDPNVVLKVSLAKDQREFRIGETIPLQLSFTSSVKNQYQVNGAQYDRSGRMGYEQFNISPSEGSIDPLPGLVGSMGGLTSFQFLTTEPWTIKLNLNEWVRFTQPGEYRLVVSSNRVGVRNPSSPSGTSAVTARSNEITLKIVRGEPAWQKRIFDDAVAILDRESNGPDQKPTRRQALETLRFLGTADAARELVKRMRGQDPGGLDYVCMLGIISSPERSVARTALEEALADPDHPIDALFLYALRTVSSNTNANNANWRETQQEDLEPLLAALPAKRGQALSISVSTALNEALNSNAVPQQTTEKLMTQVVALFDKLPLSEQNTLLGFRWEKIKSPALLPIVKRYAQAYRDFPEMRAEPAYELRQLSGTALKRWYELDPAGARSAIITEISRPRPRYDARVLGLLPDKTLPEVDFVLAENFRAAKDYDGESNVASLIARYATDAILPQVIEQLDPQIGKWACNIQNPLLAYVLRASPDSAGSLIRKAIAARGKGFSACNHDLFQIVSEIHYDPILEDIAIESLNDSDPEVVRTAATMLGKFGSPAAEPALLKRYASWSEQWAGRETQLDKIFSDGFNGDNDQLTLGLNLTQALGTGRAWLSDKAALQRLSQQTKVRRVRQQLEDYVKLWDNEPLTISIDPSFGFHAQVVQYEFQSIDALEEKLTQFASGTKFTIATATTESPTSNTVPELRKFLISHGMTVVVIKVTPDR